MMEKDETLADTPQTFENMTWVLLGNASSVQPSITWTLTTSTLYTTTTTIRYWPEEIKVKEP
jgi:hypothetical protein